MSKERLKYKNHLLELYNIFIFSSDFLLFLENKIDKKWNYQEALIFLREAINTVGIVLSFSDFSSLKSDYKTYSLLNLGNLGRMLYEIFYTTYYLFLNEEKETEELKFLVWSHHINAKRLKILQKFKSQNPELPKLQIKVEDGRKILENNLILKGYKKLRKIILDGEIDRIYTRTQILEKYNFDESLLESQYKHFCQFSHSTSLAANQLKFDNVPEDNFYSIFSTFIGNMCGLFSLIIMSFHKIYKFEIPLYIFDIFRFWENFYSLNKDKIE